MNNSSASLPPKPPTGRHPLRGRRRIKMGGNVGNEPSASLPPTPPTGRHPLRGRRPPDGPGAFLATVLSLACAALPAAAEVRFEVGGAVESADETLEVRVDVINGGDVAATSVDVRGELGDEVDQVALPNGVPAGATRSVLFRFARVPSPGVHVLGLRLDYTEAAAPGRTPVTTSQRAYLLLSLGANPAAALRLSAGEASISTRGMVPVRLESADGAPHRVRVRVLTPRGLNADSPVEVQVPAAGAATAEIPVLRGSVPRPSRQGILVVAEVLGEDAAQANVTATLVHIAPDPALMPKLRWPLAALVVALLLSAAVVEARSRRRAEAPAAAVATARNPETDVRPSS